LSKRLPRKEGNIGPGERTADGGAAGAVRRQSKIQHSRAEGRQAASRVAAGRILARPQHRNRGRGARKIDVEPGAAGFIAASAAERKVRTARTRRRGAASSDTLVSGQRRRGGE